MRVLMFASSCIGAFSTAGAARITVNGSGRDDIVKCSIDSENQDGMEVVFGVPKSKCMAECRSPLANFGQFTNTFEVTFKQEKCLCSAGGKAVVAFKPRKKLQEKDCTTTQAMKDQCWHYYKEARRTRFSKGSLVPTKKPPLASKDFIARGCKATCENDSCKTVHMPSALLGMSDEMRKILEDALQNIANGNAESVSSRLMTFINLLPEDVITEEFNILPSSTPTTTTSTSTSASTDPMVTCSARSETSGMEVVWGVPKSKCMAECGPTNGNNFTYEQMFTDTFTVSFKNEMCVCSSGGKVVSAFNPIYDIQAKECASGQSPAIKGECWKSYVKARDLHLSGNFVVERKCGESCENGSCKYVQMPSALSGLSDAEKVALGASIAE